MEQAGAIPNTQANAPNGAESIVPRRQSPAQQSYMPQESSPTRWRCRDWPC